MQNSLVTFNSNSNVVVSVNPKTQAETVRLMTAKEFKTSKGIKGNEAKRQYNAYLKEHGKASTAGLAAALTSGELLVTSVRDSKNKLAVSFTKASSLKDPAEKSETAPAITAESLAKLDYGTIPAELACRTYWW